MSIASLAVLGQSVGQPTATVLGIAFGLATILGLAPAEIVHYGPVPSDIPDLHRASGPLQLAD